MYVRWSMPMHENAWSACWSSHKHRRRARNGLMASWQFSSGSLGATWCLAVYWEGFFILFASEWESQFCQDTTLGCHQLNRPSNQLKCFKVWRSWAERSSSEPLNHWTLIPHDSSVWQRFIFQWHFWPLLLHSCEMEGPGWPRLMAWTEDEI